MHLDKEVRATSQDEELSNLSITMRFRSMNATPDPRLAPWVKHRFQMPTRLERCAFSVLAAFSWGLQSNGHSSHM
jgi:hypothetical protein